jgi:hypothetical protein
MKSRDRKSLNILLDKFFWFLLIGFFGFTAGCIVFIKFGHYTWPAYWSVSKFFIITFVLIISARFMEHISSH